MGKHRQPAECDARRSVAPTAEACGSSLIVRMIEPGAERFRIETGLEVTGGQGGFTVTNPLPRSVYYALNPVGISGKFSDPSWNIGLDYQVNDELMVYIVQRGSWRSGGFNTNSQLFPGKIDVGGAAYDPETTKDIEGGLKFNGHLGDMPARLNVDVYNQWVNKIQRTSSILRPNASSAGAIPSTGELAIPVSTMAGLGGLGSPVSGSGALIGRVYGVLTAPPTLPAAAAIIAERECRCLWWAIQGV